MWSELSELFKECNESQTIGVKLLNDSFDNKTKELNRLIKDIKKLNKEKTKILLELETVEKAIIKANSNIERAEDKCQDIQDYIDKMSKKSDENKENIENVMNVWNTIGLRIEKRDQFFNIKFNKISKSDPNKWFSVEIKVEDQIIKIVETDPKDSLDSKLIEEQINESRGQDSKLDLRFLIAFIHKHLKNNNSD